MSGRECASASGRGAEVGQAERRINKSSENETSARGGERALFYFVFTH